MENAFVRSSAGRIPFTIPPSWQVLTIADFQDPCVQADAAIFAAKALKNPVGAQSLEKQLAQGDTVSIIVEDLTRTSPKKVILAKVLEALMHIGIPREKIAVVIALGTHRPLSLPELERAFGKEVVAGYAFYNHDCHADDLVPVGQLGTGATVKINRHVYAANYRIGIGSIFPHPLNGFGGGGKILFPGVADFDSIVEHHLRHSFRGQARLGVLEGNAFYEEVTAMASAGRLDFIINSVLDHNDRLYDVVCGDPIQAHRAGVAMCRDIISLSFSEKSDVTIISAFPYAEGPQIMKPLAPADIITRKGGCIILYADCREPLPEFYFETCEAFRAKFSGGLRQAVLVHFADNRRIMADAPPELNMSMAQVMLALNDFKVILVTGDMPSGQVERLGFTAAEDLDAAIALTAELYRRPTVNIVPSGGVILPILSQSETTGRI